MKYDYISIEPGRGATYVSEAGSLTAYGHGIWPESSVLAGQESRSYLKLFKEGTIEKSLQAAQEWVEANYPGIEVIVVQWSTYSPPSLDHLPYDPEYDDDLIRPEYGFCD